MTQAAAAPDYRAVRSLDDRGFIVLGAGDGIGAQISHGLAQCGARVFCVDIVEDKARAIAEAVGGHHCAADVTSAAGVAKVLKAAQVQLGVIHGVVDVIGVARIKPIRSEEHTSELQSLMRISYAVFCLKKKKKTQE